MGFIDWLKDALGIIDKEDWVAEPWDTRNIFVYIGDISKLPLYTRHSIQAAVKEWSDRSELTLQFTDKYDNAHIKIYGKDLEGKSIGFGYFPSRTYPLAGHVQLDTSDRAWTPEILLPTLKHEIGHALGLKHNHHKASIMYYILRSRKQISYWDIKRLNELYRS